MDVAPFLVTAIAVFFGFDCLISGLIVEHVRVGYVGHVQVGVLVKYERSNTGCWTFWCWWIIFRLTVDTVLVRSKILIFFLVQNLIINPLFYT